MKPSNAIALALAVSAGLAAPAGAQPADVPALLVPAGAPPQPAPAVPAAPVWAPSLKTRAMLTTWYAFDTLREDQLVIRRFNVWLVGEVAPGLSYTGMFQPHKLIALPGIRAGSDGTAQVVRTGDSAVLQDAFISWTPWRWAGLTVGQFRPALSAEARNPAPQLSLARRAMFLEGNPFGFYRDRGAELWLQPHPAVKLTGGVYNGETNNMPETNHLKDALIRLDLTSGLPFKVGLSALAGTTSGAQPQPKRRVDADAAWRSGPWEVSGEALWGSDGPVARLGAYTQVSRSDFPWLSVARLEGYDEDLAVDGGRFASTLGGYYAFSPQGSKVGLNWIHELATGAKPQAGDTLLVQFQAIQ